MRNLHKYTLLLYVATVFTQSTELQYIQDLPCRTWVETCLTSVVRYNKKVTALCNHFNMNIVLFCPPLIEKKQEKI